MAGVSASRMVFPVDSLPFILVISMPSGLYRTAPNVLGCPFFSDPSV